MRRGFLTLSLVAALALPIVPAAADDHATAAGSNDARQTYYLVSRGDTCGALSIERRDRGAPTDGCGNPFYGLLSPASRETERRMTHVAIDGLPFTFDASKQITGSVAVRSYLAVGVARRDAVGVGRPVLEVALIAILDGQEMKIGDYVSEPYTITPVARDYVINFHIDPDPSLTGRVVQGVKLKLRTSGPSVFHGFYPADGRTRLSLGVLTSRDAPDETT